MNVYKVNASLSFKDTVVTHNIKCHVLAGPTVDSVIELLTQEYVGQLYDVLKDNPFANYPAHKGGGPLPPMPARVVVKINIFSIESVCTLDLISPKELINSGILEITPDDRPK